MAETPVRVDFKFMAEDDLSTFGEYFEDTNRIAVYIIPHSECVANLFSTISHEVFHKIITDFDVTIDIEQEHNLIKKVMWFEQDLV